MRNVKCGMRNVAEGVARRATFHVNSAFGIPHSALGGGGGGNSRLPRPFLESRRAALSLARRATVAPARVSSTGLRGRDRSDPYRSHRVRGGQLPAGRSPAGGGGRGGTGGGMVAFVDVAQGLGARGSGLGKKLEAFSRSTLVKGIRQNIQGHSAGFCVQRAFIEGVREVRS